MKDLPTELWTKIAKELKREPPPAGTKANWNDHFHQQDLVSLQRVNKELYGVVCPILYHAPVVQNLGLFLRGIDKPLPPSSAEADHDKNDQSVPSHKATLLDLVITLHVIHASSRNPLRKPYIKTRISRYFESAKVVRWNRADRLARADLVGWRMAKRLMDAAEFGALPVTSQITFKNIRSFSFGAWDDGRWEIYKDQSSVVPDSKRYCNVNPFFYLKSILADLLRPIQNSKPVDVCLNVKSGIYYVWKWPECLRAEGSAIRVIHELNDDYDIAPRPEPGRSRVFMGAWSYETDRTNPQNLILHRDHKLFRSYDQYLRFASSSAKVKDVSEGQDRSYPVYDDMRLELCIIPDHRFANEASIPRQLVIARQIKQALEKYHHDTAMAQEYAKKTLGKIKIYTAEDMPACPCCGLRETFE